MSQYADTPALQAVQRLLSTDHLSYTRLGALPPKALLLSGPPGIGKTKSVHIAAARACAPLFTVVPSTDVRHSLTVAFSSARNARNANISVVFIDEIDAICPATVSTSNSASSSATALLLSFMDPPPVPCLWGRTRKHPFVFFIAATNRPNAIHPSLRRAGRLDNEVVLTPPCSDGRLDILVSLVPQVGRKVLELVAQRAVGFVAADLSSLCSAARDIATSRFEDEAPELSVLPTLNDFRTAFHHIKPSILRTDLAAEVPSCSWNDIGGLDDVKKRLIMDVEWPLLHTGTFNHLGLKAPRGILLHGPPGCSKTTLVRAAASQSHAAFIRLNGADIYSCYLGEAERILREGFATAQAAAPCILFLDEIDAIVGKRSVGGRQTDGNGVQERVLSTLLTEMDGVVSATGVLVIGATNRVDLLDDALLRPGRFDDILKVGLPDEAERLQILGIHTQKLPLGTDVNLLHIARQTVGQSGADLKSLCTEAALAAIRERFTSNQVPNFHTDEEGEKISINRKHFKILP